tara:strand:- start:11279 stop:12310 length:1032 start_codon:yes stop_codon:yes gene_type:complete
MNIAFRVDSSEKIGSGHFTRCFAFSNLIKKSKKKIFFISKNLSLTQKKLIKKNKINLINLDKNFSSSKDDISFFINLLSKNNISTLILDNYETKNFFKAEIKKYLNKLIVIDDRINEKHNCNILINSNFINKNEKIIIKKMNPSTQIFMGLHCSPTLPKKFVLRKIRKFKKVFVFFGTVDKENFTEKILRILSKYNSFSVYVVIGIFNKRKKILKKKYSKKHIKIFEDIDNKKILKIIGNSDFAIGSGGVNLVERISLCLPSIVISKIKNQRKSLKNLKNSGLIIKKKISDVNENFFKDLILENTHEFKKLMSVTKLTYDMSSKLKKDREIFFNKNLPKILNY